MLILARSATQLSLPNFYNKSLNQTKYSKEASSFDISKIDQFNLQLAEVMNQLHEDEKKSVVLDEAINQHKGTQLFKLEKSHDSLAEFTSNVKNQLSDIEIAETLILFSEKGVEFFVAQKKKKQKFMWHSMQNVCIN
ncbi:hypothetical protein HKD37_10G027904 [Glycine soja]